MKTEIRYGDKVCTVNGDTVFWDTESELFNRECGARNAEGAKKLYRLEKCPCVTVVQGEGNAEENEQSY